MIPTFLQKRRASGIPLRLGVIVTSLVLLVAVHTIAISLVIVERGYSKGGKLAVIGLLLTMALLSLGIFERLRR